MESHGPSSLLQEWVTTILEERPSPVLFQQRINDIIFKYEEQEKKDKEESKFVDRVDEDGFVKVQSKKSKRAKLETLPPASTTKSEATDKSLTDFYAFQIRTNKLNQLQELRQKFEEDKKRIARMKESRKFKPS